MIKSIVALFLAGVLLTGSVIFPLGDFSLMKDLPGMYHSYCKVKAGKPDIIDFVGDYLLGGKELLGHNAHDARSGGSLQFQHTVNISLFFTEHIYQLSFLSETKLSTPAVFPFIFHTSGYRNEHFRPPLA